MVKVQGGSVIGRPSPIVVPLACVVLPESSVKSHAVLPESTYTREAASPPASGPVGLSATWKAASRRQTNVPRDVTALYFLMVSPSRGVLVSVLKVSSRVVCVWESFLSLAMMLLLRSTAWACTAAFTAVVPAREVLW